jgi:hypothetical protein
LARETSGKQSSSSAVWRRPRERSLRRAGGSSRPTSARRSYRGGPTKWQAARVGEEKQAGVEFTVRHPWRTAAARRPREEGLAGFIAVHKAVRDVFLRAKGTKSRYGSRHDRSTARMGGGDVRRVRRHVVGWAARL